MQQVAAGKGRTADFRNVLADQALFRSWYEEALPYVYGFLLDRCGRRSLAEELTQETLVEAVRSHASFDGRSDVLTWLCAIARHKLADHFRRLDREERRRTRLLARRSAVEVAESSEETDAREAVWRTLRALPAMQCAALSLHYLDGLSMREIAEILDRSESAVESLLSRGRESFKRIYGGDDE